MILAVSRASNQDNEPIIRFGIRHGKEYRHGDHYYRRMVMAIYGRKARPYEYS